MSDRQPPRCTLRRYSCPGKSDYWQAMLPKGMFDMNGKNSQIRAFPGKRPEEDAIAECEAWLLLYGPES